MRLCASRVQVSAPRSAASRARNRGSAALEFALSGVVFLTFLFGLISLCQAVFTYETVSYAARKAARWAMVRGSGCASNASPEGPNPSCWCHYPPSTLTTCSATGATVADISAYVQTIITKGIYLGNTTTTYVWPGGGPSSCTAGSNSRGCPVQVYVSYPFTLEIPFFSFKAFTISAHSEMMISQ